MVTFEDCGAEVARATALRAAETARMATTSRIRASLALHHGVHGELPQIHVLVAHLRRSLLTLDRHCG